MFISAIVTADLNGDGKLDLASNCSTGTCVFPGIGNGQFSNPEVSGASGLVLNAADFNNDGKLDLVALSSPTTASILLGNGNGTFGPPMNYPTASEEFYFVVGDFNGDGRLDLITINYFQSIFSTYLQTVNPVASLSPSSLLFVQPQTAGTLSAAQRFTVTNTGNAALNISSIAGTTQFITKENTCGESLLAGASCTVNVQFRPTGKGPRTGAITVTDNAPGSPQMVSLSGTGTLIKLSNAGESIQFGNVPEGTTSSPQTVTMTNVSVNETANISSIVIGGAKAFDFGETNTCGASLAPLASCTITLTFKPKDRGPRQANLNIYDNAGASPQTVQLEGTGT